MPTKEEIETYELMSEEAEGTTNLTQLLEEVQRGAIARVHKLFPGVVKYYDHKKQTANVQPALLQKQRFAKDYVAPELDEIPVSFPGSGGYSMTWPLEVGDHVWVYIPDRCIQLWKEQGGERVDPYHPWMHQWTDAIAIPAGRPPDANAFQYARAKGLRIGEDRNKGDKALDDDGACITIHDGKIAIGNKGSELIDLVGQLAKQVKALVQSLTPIQLAAFATQMGLDLAPKGQKELTDHEVSDFVVEPFTSIADKIESIRLGL